jgi:hypothetical protein
MDEQRAFDWEMLEFYTQEARIRMLKQRVEALVGTEATTFVAPDAPLDIIEQFWRNVLEYEEKDQGLVPSATLPPLDFPDAATLTGDELHSLLWRKIEELAERRIFLEQTDHLSDRELYSALCSAEMKELTTQAVPDDGMVGFDILGGYSEEDIELYLRYYADDLERDRWKGEWPNDPMPEKETPPFARDAKLPKPPMPWVPPEDE